MRSTIGQQFDRWMQEHFVGRSFETGMFRRCLESLDVMSARILNVYGTAGMGKTYLLDRFEAIARETGAAVARVSIPETGDDPAMLERTVNKKLGLAGRVDPSSPETGGSIERIHELGQSTKVVLLLDGYEEAARLDYWLRSSYLPQLPRCVLIVISGRYPLEGPWTYLPFWKKLIIRLPLAELSYEEIRSYLLHWGIREETAIDAIWLRTLGHPLAMSLLTPSPDDALVRPITAVMPPDAGRSLEMLLDFWLEEAPDDELREWLFAASVARTFHQELLEELAGKPLAPGMFDKLVRLSFVQRSPGGWQLHELVWEHMRSTFKRRMPDAFERFRRIAVAHAARKLDAGPAGDEGRSRQLADLLHFAGNPVMRAHYRHSRTSPHYREPVTDGNAEELREYVRLRKGNPRAWKVRCSDPESGSMYRFAFTAGESLLRLSLLDVDRLMELPREGGGVQLLRSPSGRVIGVFAAIPVEPGTMDFLRAAPVSRALFKTLTPERKAVLEEAARQRRAWYVYSVDVENLENEQLRSDIVRHLFDLLLGGNLIVMSPPPLDYYEEAARSIGFETVPGAEHLDYGGAKPAPTYWLDTRDGKFAEFLRGAMEGMSPTPAGEETEAGESVGAGEGSPAIAVGEFTERENEVAALIAQGQTNAEIAAALFVSEAAVKKHVNSMLSKLGLKNRTQLAKRVLEGG